LYSPLSCTGGEWTTVSEFAPNSAGAVFGFTNILAFAHCVIAPYIVGIRLDSESGASQQDKWNLIFYITAAIYVLGYTVFLIFGTDIQQSWDKIADEDKDKSTEHEESGAKDHNNSNNNKAMIESDNLRKISIQKE